MILVSYDKCAAVWSLSSFAVVMLFLGSFAGGMDVIY